MSKNNSLTPRGAPNIETGKSSMFMRSNRGGGLFNRGIPGGR